MEAREPVPSACGDDLTIGRQEAALIFNPLPHKLFLRAGDVTSIINRNRIDDDDDDVGGIITVNGIITGRGGLPRECVIINGNYAPGISVRN